MNYSVANYYEATNVLYTYILKNLMMILVADYTFLYTHTDTVTCAGCIIWLYF